MKSFTDFILESYKGPINWIIPNPETEHGEVFHQLNSHSASPFLPDWVHKRLSELKDKSEFQKAMNSGKTKTFTRKDVENTGNTGDKWYDVENDEKKRRAPRLYGKDKKVQRPVYLENPKTKERWLLGGHHRSTYVTDVMKRPVEAHVIQ